MKESLGALYAVAALASTWYAVQAGLSLVSGLADKRKEAQRRAIEDDILKKLQRQIDDERRWRI